MADVDSMHPSAVNSDVEGETFEDAPDTATHPVTNAHSSSSISSSRRASVYSNTAHQVPEVVSKPDGNGSQNDVQAIEALEDPIPEMDPPKSSLFTSHRVSTSSLDNIPLSGTPNEEPARSHSIVSTSNGSAIKPPLRPPPRSLGLSGSIPSIPWGQPSPTPPSRHSTLPAPSPPIRKLTSPFSWLSRNTSANKDPLPQQVHNSMFERRNTASSIATTGSNSDLMLSKLEEGQESGASSPGLKGPPRNSLRDRFKLLRMREEAGISTLDPDEVGSPVAGSAIAAMIGRSASLGVGIGSPTSIADEKEGGLAKSPLTSPTIALPHANQLASNVNPNLAPGTVSGISAGPSVMIDPGLPVDWDLWQSVVYEGPAAVARSSAEELHRAIAGGIPSAIRGVVWQVLAQSKNEELEGVYHELVARGTDKDWDRISAPSGPAVTYIPVNGSSKDKEAIVSSGSSIHSEHSTPATTTANSVTSPTPSNEKDADNINKLKAAMIAERKKKAKEDANALQKLEKAIRRDLGSRTSYSKYAAAAGLQDGLFGVCKAYALFDEGVGYAQGMNFLVMPLLFNMSEEEAFCLLVGLMNQYHLREMFIQDMPGLHLHLYQFERLLEDREPALYCHLHRRGVTPQLYATQWFLTLFAYRFPLQLVLRIYDLILSEGLEGAILKFGIVLMQKNAETLLGMTDMGALTSFLKDKLFDVYIDQAPSASSILESGFFGSSGGIDKEVYRADVLVQDACDVKLTSETLKLYTADWEESVRIEKDREAELEALRSANVSLSLKIRSLEERAEKSDTDHVHVASEIVRTKVENQTLQDENESLKGQVDELRRVVDKQPEELEQRLKEEMERIMKRNIEVQNENRALEEQMAEMEKSLVETKMRYAEIHSEHESLKQKWTEVRKALD